MLLFFLLLLLTVPFHSLFGVRVPHAVHGRNVHQNVRARHTDILRFSVQPFRLRRHHGLHIRGRVVGRQRRFVRSVRAESIEAVADIQSDKVNTRRTATRTDRERSVSPQYKPTLQVLQGRTARPLTITRHPKTRSLRFRRMPVKVLTLSLRTRKRPQTPSAWRFISKI